MIKHKRLSKEIYGSHVKSFCGETVSVDDSHAIWKYVDCQDCLALKGKRTRQIIPGKRKCDKSKFDQFYHVDQKI
jgi:hypothetical protein